MNIIKCPVCNNVLQKTDKTYKCMQNHTFDIAKQGYANLLQSNQAKIHGDSKKMQLARHVILYGEYYRSISNALNQVVQELNPTTILDLGTGVGYYCDKLQLALPSKTYHGIDISKLGVKEAAKQNKDITYLVGSNNNLPYIDNAFDMIINVFSPIYIDECVRTLQNKGYILTITPNTNHLMELKEIVYKEIINKDYEVNKLEHPSLQHLDAIDVISTISLSNPDLYSLFMMTPHYWKTSQEVKEVVRQTPVLQVTIDVVINIYQKN